MQRILSGKMFQQSAPGASVKTMLRLSSTLWPQVEEASKK